MQWWFRQQLYIKILVCIVIGIGFGLLFGDYVSYIEPIGEAFIRLLKMLIVPLTFFTLISGMTKMGDVRRLRSVGGMILLYYVVTSLLAAAVGMSMALILQPGEGVQGLLQQGATVETTDFNFIDNLVGWIPTNPIEALATMNMLQVIVFSVIVGIALLALGKKTENLAKLANEGAELMIKVTDFVMKLAPYGILALIANMVGTLGTDLLAEVSRFIMTDILSMVIILLLIYPLLIWFVGKLNPLRFYRNIAPAMLVAAGTTSSLATLPVSMRVAEKNIGVPEKIFGFTLPLGATINMDGMAAAIGVIAVFASNLYGLAVTPQLMFQFVFLGLVLSIGTAGVKSAGVVISSILLQTLGMPLTLIPILAAIWPVLDIGHTTCNITGDLNGTSIVGSRLGELDKEIFDC